ALPPPEKRAQPPAALVQREGDLLADLVVVGDGFLRLAGERYPDRRHVDEDHHRAGGERAARLRDAVVAPGRVEDRLEDRAGGLRIEQRHAIRVADDARDLAVGVLLLAL